MPQTFSAHLSDALARTAACVGLDPVLERLPEAVRAEHWEPTRAIEQFCRGVLAALAEGGSPAVSIVKPQSACFERYGSPGWGVLERIVRQARDMGLLVILDAKRGDIGISGEHYAAAAAALGAHAITVNAYLGPETVEPYLAAGLGVFVLVRTSNPGSDVVQGRALSDGRTVAGMMAQHVELLGRSRGHRGVLSSVGAVVGATKAAEGRALRELMPDTPFLVPGYGAQGGTADDVRTLVRPGATGPATAGVVVNSSRAVLYPPTPDPARWREAIAGAAAALVADLATVVTGG